MLHLHNFTKYDIWSPYWQPQPYTCLDLQDQGRDMDFSVCDLLKSRPKWIMLNTTVLTQSFSPTGHSLDSLATAY